MLTGEFRPRVLPPRGMWIAWALAGVTGMAVWVLERSDALRLTILRPLFWLLLLAALLVSLNHWLERRTRLFLDEKGIRFSNGLRTASLAWSQIQGVRLQPDRFTSGRLVTVLGPSGVQSFRFSTAGEVRSGRQKVRVGFEEGDAIVQTLIERAGLQAQPAAENEAYYAAP